jgi:hypothetical protein
MKLQQLQGPSEINGCNQNTIRCKVSRHKGYNSKNKNVRDLYRGRSEFKRGCQPSSNLVKD